MQTPRSQLPGGFLLDCYEAQILEVLTYEPETGLFRWRIHTRGRGRKISPGDVAGTLSGQGYVQIKTLGRLVRAHRLAYLFMTGEWPPKGMEPDHKNGRRNDNRWENLRLVTRSQNNLNAGLRKSNKSGVTGVSFQARRGVWDARIKVDGRLYLLGQHKTKEEAIIARRDAERRLTPDHRPRPGETARPKGQ